MLCAEVRLIANAFIVLQENRHNADYNLGAVFSRQEALAAAAQVQDAIDAWNALAANHSQTAHLFALALMLWSGLSGH
jgi:hypothetical protein